ncbi:hypothetical protein [Treponema putidum]|uniref:Uncharacterized protein n=1 Tax=Treponema putidum TaxID=221027 RepID=A0AAE9SMI6_9SPIR|nr:hypothetical protein [Treponema putidum]AIN94683.1 hypothetical protein JO40_11825 [Treponema putidum]TWI77550.1 hypothetical protein JM98_01244 [Treponema putidum]UTY28701.1 hypothetical protein E4N76_06610 [Treponema putidum]UTY34894.1 hypothetical protein E4N74_05720 [Treponema putidum]
MIDLKSKISGILKNIKASFFHNRKTVIIVVCVLIFILILSLLLILVLQKKDDASYKDDGSYNDNASYSEMKRSVLSSDTSDFKSGKIDVDKLQIIDEPLHLPPIQFSREQRKIWEKEEADYWYEPPTEKDMEELHKQNKKLTDKILEDAP